MSTSDNINLPELAQAVERERMASIENGELSHKEALHAVLEKQHKMPAFKPKESHPTPTTQSVSVSDYKKEVLPEYAGEESEQAQNKVLELIDLTFSKGLATGIRAAKAQDPVVMDMYHDALVDKLLEKLKEKNLI